MYIHTEYFVCVRVRVRVYGWLWTRAALEVAVAVEEGSRKHATAGAHLPC